MMQLLEKRHPEFVKFATERDPDITGSGALDLDDEGERAGLVKEQATSLKVGLLSEDC